MLDLHSNLFSVNKRVDLEHLSLAELKTTLHLLNIGKPMLIQGLRNSKNKLYKIGKTSHMTLVLINEEKSHHE